MNYLQLAQRVRLEAGLSGNGPASVTGQTGMDSKLCQWVNTAWEEIQLMRNDWRFNWTTASIPVATGAASISPESFGVNVDVWVDRTISLTPVSGGDKLYMTETDWPTFSRYHQTTEQGRPTVFAFAPDKSIRFSKVPEQDYTLTGEYFQTPQLLASNTDVPRMPERYHMAIVYKALMMYAAHDDAAATMVDARIRFMEIMNRVESTELPQTIAGIGPLDEYTG
jgi:hypothetical protein